MNELAQEPGGADRPQDTESVSPKREGSSLVFYLVLFTASFILIMGASYLFFAKYKARGIPSETQGFKSVADSLSEVSDLERLSADSVATASLPDSQKTAILDAVSDSLAVPEPQGTAEGEMTVTKEFVAIIEGYERQLGLLEQTNFRQRGELDSLRDVQRHLKAELETMGDKLLTQIDQRVGAKIEELEAVLAEDEQAETAKVRGAGPRDLAKIYDAMRAEEAAAVLAQLEIDTVAQIIVMLKQRQAAKILGAMDSRRAAQVSKKINQLKSG